MAKLAKITPWLWFDDEAEQAAKYYTGIFKNSKILETTYYSAAGPRPKGMVMTVSFELEGLPFFALNGGPDFNFTEAVSFSIDCEDQAEVDRYWDALIEGGGEPSQCGWLKDQFGLSWQVVPRQLNEMLQSSDGDAAKRAMEAMLKMGKLDVAKLREAFEGVPA